MLQVDMTARRRDIFGKGAARTLRREGLTPAIVYGPQVDPVPLTLETRSFTRQLMEIHGRNAIVSLSMENDQAEKRHVILKEVQKDPIRDILIHADFYEISLEQEAVFAVPLKFSGTAKGVDLGGMLHVVKTSVQLKGLPLEIPDFIEIDITHLTLGGEGVHCRDLAIPGKLEMLEEADAICVSVIHPKRAVLSEEEEAAEAEAAAEEAGGEEAEAGGEEGAATDA